MSEDAIHERYPDGVPFVNDISNKELIDQDVFIIGEVKHFKGSTLYMKLNPDSHEISVTGFRGEVPSNNYLAIIGKVVTSDSIEFIDSFTNGLQDFELFDQLQKYFYILSQKKELSKFV